VSQASVVYTVALLGTWIAARVIRNHSIRTALYLAASWSFYISLDLRFFPLLLGSSLFNYLFGRVVRRRPRLLLLWVGIACNILLLGVFKYVPEMPALLPDSAFWAHVAGLALPVGISFWTFQALSHLFDQYRGDDVQPTLGEFCLYMTFAPTVISGPICRSGDLVPQFRAPFRGTGQTVCEGAQSVWVGIGMVTLARILAAGYDGFGIGAAFGWRPNVLSTADVWIVLLGYGFQIFFDFAGYSRLVIGVALMFGIRLPENFDRPYLSTTPTEFWQRWHMSLSFWIRDYVFLPLAMTRREVWWRNAALVVSMVIFGLWHKASWLFLLWGTYQGVLLLLHRSWQQRHRGRVSRVPHTVGAIGSWLMTFLAINLSWILFRAEDVRQAGEMFYAALSLSGGLHLPVGFALLVLLTICGYFASQWLVVRAGRQSQGLLSWLPMPARFACYAVIFYLAVFRPAEPQAFIYSQF
jgi:alginate O-acetyltransferase complex protein AlgI